MISVAELANKQVRTKRLKKEYTFVLPDNLMGVEVEVDNDSTGLTVFADASSLGYWRRHHDGSLVNGYEYTLSMPLAGDTLGEAIAELYAPPSSFTRTFTGSTHIHMDMLEEHVSVATLRTLVLMVYALEPMLYAAGDSSREWCGYANSLKSADPLLLSTLFSDDVESSFRRVYTRGGQLGRYYGLNMAALNDYGSLEFRYFPTATSDTELVRWINLVQSFKKAALSIGSPEALKDIINNEDSFNGMLQEFFGEYRSEQEALNGWRSVHSFFTKAGIIVKDAQLEDLGRFMGQDVFKSGKFGNVIGDVFVTPPGLAENGDYTVHTDGVVPSSPNEGDVLVYSNRVYCYRSREWRVATEILRDGVSLPTRAVTGLYRVMMYHAELLPPSVLESLAVVIAGLGAMEVAPESHEAEDYDEEDEDFFELDDEF